MLTHNIIVQKEEDNSNEVMQELFRDNKIPLSSKKEEPVRQKFKATHLDFACYKRGQGKTDSLPNYMLQQPKYCNPYNVCILIPPALKG